MTSEQMKMGVATTNSSAHCHLQGFTRHEDADERVRQVIDNGNRKQKLTAVKEYVSIDKLVSDPDAQVRGAIAEEGYFLDVLRDDAHPLVRCAVARHGMYLEELSGDPHPWVRSIVALLIQDNPERLVEDESRLVRLSLVKRGIQLERFAHDPCSQVSVVAYCAIRSNKLASI